MKKSLFGYIPSGIPSQTSDKNYGIISMPEYAYMKDEGLTESDYVTDNRVFEMDLNRGSYSGSGSTVTDLAGNYDGTLTGATYTAGDSTNPSYFTFDADSEEVSWGNVGTYANSSIELWWYSTSVTNYRNAMDGNFGSNASNTGPRLEQNNSGTVGMVYGNNSGTFTSQQFVSSNHPANTWKQYVFTYSTTNGSVGYINGSSIGNNSSTLFGGNYGNFEIGQGFTTDSVRSFRGRISIVRLYQKVLSASEVTKNWTFSRSRFGL